MFVSSTGALTAGRSDPDHALFPYYTDDRIHDSQDQTGGKTILLVTRGGRTSMWEPFSQRYEGLYRITRSFVEERYSNKIVFEEVNHDLAVSFSCAWMTSDRFGFVRRATLVNLRRGTGRNRSPRWHPEPVAARPHAPVPDGVQHAGGRVQGERARTRPGLGLFKLGSVPADRPEPNEALRVTTVWSEGIERACRLLSSVQLDRFRRGEDGGTRKRSCAGRRGAYFVNTRLSLSCKRPQSLDIRLGCGSGRGERSVHGRAAQIRRELARATGRRRRARYAQPGSHRGRGGRAPTHGDELSSYRHFSNALFNTMRGGIPDRGYWISRPDFKTFIAKANRPLAEEQAAFLNSLPELLLHDRLLALVREQAHPDLERLAHEYLPLTFSRRHGDPSRPWNIFSIAVKDEHGGRILNYQGNWRDIFQNWEALALSFPGYVESMIFKFADASTADGYNPYRIMRDGFDWEVLDPHDAWSYIGYWGDHQVAYLLKLIEASLRYHPDAIGELLTRRVFTYADVPYRIKPYQKLLEDPRNTIEFDAPLDREIRKRADAIGEDGKALPGPDNAPYRVNLAEKLLVLILARLFNYIPEAGLWMNTQRPEWNDANNALVGYGVSVVTLCYLRRFLSVCETTFSCIEEIPVSLEVAEALFAVGKVLSGHLGLLGGEISDRDRKTVLDALGSIGSDYRERIYSNGFSGARQPVAAAYIRGICRLALRHTDHSIRANRRDDGLYHTYNLMRLEDDGIAIERSAGNARRAGRGADVGSTLCCRVGHAA